MTRHTTLESFIVRIYRVDTADRTQIAGQVQFLDGSGEQKPFAGLEALAEILNRCAEASGKSGEKHEG